MAKRATWDRIEPAATGQADLKNRMEPPTPPHHLPPSTKRTTRARILQAGPVLRMNLLNGDKCQKLTLLGSNGFEIGTDVAPTHPPS